MYDFPTTDALRAGLTKPLEPRLHNLLQDRLADTIHCGLELYTHVLVVEAEDREEVIVQAIGFSPLETRIDNVRGELDCDWIEHHDGWWELLYAVGNEGFAYIVLVEDHIDQPLARICRQQEVRL